MSVFVKRVNNHFTYLGRDVFENLVDCLGGLVENFLCLFNFGGTALQILVCLPKILLEFFYIGFGIPNVRLDLLFRLLVANQRFILSSNDVVKIVQPRLGSSQLFILKLYPNTG